MDITLAVHVAAGTLALVSGYVALYAPKGATLHRRSGMVFACAMLVMCSLGVVLAIGRRAAPELNVPAGLLTGYLVVTSLATVRPLGAAARWVDRAGMVVALAVGIACVRMGIQAAQTQGMMAFGFFLFGFVGLAGGLGDVRMLRSGPPRGARRIARHLWRMTFALFIAAMSFFIGQADVIPAPLRRGPLLATPVLAVLATMLYWLWRIRVRQKPGGFVSIPAPEIA